MKCSGFLLVASLVLASAASARVQGRATWDKCSSDGGVTSGTFSCDANTGGQSLLFSIISDEPLVGVLYAQAELDVMTENSCQYVIDSWGAPLPPLLDYWKLGSSECRSGALSVSTGFTDTENCSDLWQGIPVFSAVGVENVSPSQRDVARWRVVAGTSTPVFQADAGVEYVVLRYRIQNTHSSGSGACVGCCQQRVWMCPSMTLFVNADPAPISIPVEFDWEWRGVTRMGSGTTCSTVPTRGRSWGQIKGLYR
jgi:hypothetical protein